MLRLRHILLALVALSWVSPLAAQRAPTGASRQDAHAQPACPQERAKATTAKRQARTIIIKEPSDGSMPLLGHPAFAP